MNTKRILISGNEAIAEGAIQAGCRFYAGYPITPQNEIPAYFARRMPEVGGTFIQAESELAAINMVFGASAAGARAMTSSSSPGISLKQEGISYLAGCLLPAVIVNVMRGGPGLGNISPSQSDYFQATKGGGHGDYHIIVLAPATIQEAFDLTISAFDLADKYRTPVMILADGLLGQMMEPLTQMNTDKKIQMNTDKKPWALTGAKGRKPNIIRSLFLKEGALEELNNQLQKKYQQIQEKEVLFDATNVDECNCLVISYGTMARIASGVIDTLKQAGLKVGLFRPISLWPFPKKEIKKISKNKKILVIEMSAGQMLEDVLLSVDPSAKVEFLGRTGGGIPTEEEIINKIAKLPNC
ncbi:MAG: 3-methyl-2-oxobutanoate dehydrogenase subunit VorB [Candidatus Omnitrophota bacterium]